MSRECFGSLDFLLFVDLRTQPPTSIEISIRLAKYKQGRAANEQGHKEGMIPISFALV